ncbi:hyalin-like [Diadema antillarum]|uniref:hyalin-like n=1 Tax=Diadema antillarum TaxID=105358 RepID=UPI003A87DA92
MYILFLDNESPSITGCPSDQSLNTSAGNATAVATWMPPSATDNSNTSVTLTTTHNPGDSFPIGTTNVTYTASDSDGNNATCVFTITVSDVEDPTISSCPNDTVVNTDAGNSTAVVNWTPPTASDNSGSVTLNSTDNPGDSFSIGTTTVTYTATDGSLNSVSTCEFNVTVIDNEDPVINGCPNDTSVNTGTGNATVTVTWTPPTASDNSGSATLSSTHNPGDDFPIGSTTVTYNASDASSNSVSTCSFVVNVTDNENPVFASCPSDILTNTTTGLLVADVTWTVPNATDNSGSVTVNQTAGLSPGSNFTVGSTLVTYTVTDPSGNSASCSFYVNVTDMQDPMFTSCPSNQTVGTDYRLNSTTVNWTEPVVSDNDMYTVTSDYSSGSVFYVGSTLVTYTAVDSSSNTETCTFTITVEDQEAPYFNGTCPSSRSAQTARLHNYRTRTWPAPTVLDNVDESQDINITSSHSSGDQFYVGTTTVFINATDQAGNVAVCSFTITIRGSRLS